VLAPVPAAPYCGQYYFRDNRSGLCSAGNGTGNVSTSNGFDRDTPMFDFSEMSAIHGGPKTKRTPFPPRRHRETEKRLLMEVIDSDVLFFYLGTKVSEFQKPVHAHVRRTPLHRLFQRH